MSPKCNTICNTGNTKQGESNDTKITSIRVPSELLREAKELGLNISKVSSNALKQAIQGMHTRQGFFPSKLSSKERFEVGPPRFELGTFAMSRRHHNR
jgi:hypothetical protein